MKPIVNRIADELNVKPGQIEAAITLLDEGATVPFIARYRKEATGGLDDTQMRQLEDRLRYLRELDERRNSILKLIAEQNKLTPELEQRILVAETKNQLEDLYLPYKQKRRTKAQIAREAGIEPLADSLLANPDQQPDVLAAAYIDAEKGFADSKAVLDGAKQILMERFSEDAVLLGDLRERLWQEGLLVSKVSEGKEKEGEKFRDYFDFSEALKKIPSHRALALFRGRNEGVLQLAIKLPDEADQKIHPCEQAVANHWHIKHQGRAADDWLAEVVRWTWRVKLLTHLETDLMGQVREAAEAEAIKVFGLNLKDLLLAAPAGQKATMGLDPGLRTGVKVAVIDATGKVLDHAAIFPNPPQNKQAEAAKVVVGLCRKHGVELISIGNGTASRETERFVGDIIKSHPELGLRKVVVNEAGASVYSASEFAAKEFPDLDVTIRGAVSIARRLQDPLAELVKIEPKSIGVGQYQHDVSQVQLSRTLDAVVEDCVNAVGVDVNTASVPLLAKVSGLNQTLAANIVDFRDANGSFSNREQLKKVSRFGDKTFEQAAGFLRIVKGDNPLDASSVHPEAYALVERMAEIKGMPLEKLVGNSAFVRSLQPRDFVTEQFGLPTVTDILKELEKPGRDPRPEFKTASFQEGVEKIADLKEGMVLEGTVTNVTNFGAFVDVGVHQDGLVHISALADTFVKDPRDVVKAGDIVKVKVMEVDADRKRIALSMRMGDEPASKSKRVVGKPQGAERKKSAARPHSASKPASTSAPAKGTFAQLFDTAKNRKGGRL
ncbi:MAG: RNA-binding transcriptional accessory protein [Pseudomonadales bacterium]|nr:RNA-binding transcriptional accessory protein [Pseudomonadales bacterium]